MNEIRIDIPFEESKKIEKLFHEYQSYCNLLGYLSGYGSLDDDNVFFDRKWTEAIQINMELEELKIKMSEQYRPKDESYASFHFDFDNSQIVYVK